VKFEGTELWIKRNEYLLNRAENYFFWFTEFKLPLLRDRSENLSAKDVWDACLLK
jgi:hypothetical protein